MISTEILPRIMPLLRRVAAFLAFTTLVSPGLEPGTFFFRSIQAISWCRHCEKLIPWLTLVGIYLIYTWWYPHNLCLNFHYRVEEGPKTPFSYLTLSEPCMEIWRYDSWRLSQKNGCFSTPVETRIHPKFMIQTHFWVWRGRKGGFLFHALTEHLDIGVLR